MIEQKIDWILYKKKTITNIYFKYHKRTHEKNTNRLYNNKRQIQEPSDKNQNLSTTDIGSHLKLVMMQYELKLKKISQERRKMQSDWHIDKTEKKNK